MTALQDFADMGDVIDDFAEPFLIVRRPAGAYVQGRFVEAGDDDTIDASGSVTPATLNDLQHLPEGRRTDETMRVITRFELVLLPQADVIEWNGKEWEVSHVGPWTSPGFFDCLMVKRVTA